MNLRRFIRKNIPSRSPLIPLTKEGNISSTDNFFRGNHLRSKLCLIFMVGCFIGLNLAKESLGKNIDLPIQQSKARQNNNQCPKELPELANLLVKDISDYANRVMQKSRPSLAKGDFFPVYVITASQPELKPIEIQQTQYREIKESQVEQIFFTTLERQYSNPSRVIETQNYHWLLLTPTSQGWQIVMLLTRFGTSNNSVIYSPPQDSTNGVMGQAVKLWLRDCQSNL